MKQGDEARSEPGHFHLFVYGTLRAGGPAAALLEGCECVGHATVAGTLYSVDAYPALVLTGTGDVQGEVWRCPATRLADLDRYEGVADGLFRRVGIRAGEWACWTYVAGPALAPRLRPGQRIDSGRW
ncbi:MAG TPA: gamma-glutamylcyclotransferase family protein [Longimicrobiales bacterium]